MSVSSTLEAMAVGVEQSARTGYSVSPQQLRNVRDLAQCKEADHEADLQAICHFLKQGRADAAHTLAKRRLAELQGALPCETVQPTSI